MPKWSSTTYMKFLKNVIEQEKILNGPVNCSLKVISSPVLEILFVQIYTCINTEFLLSLLKVSYILQGTGQHEDFMGHKGKLKTGDVQVIYTCTYQGCQRVPG